MKNILFIFTLTVLISLISFAQIPCINPIIHSNESIDLCNSEGKADFAFTGWRQLYSMAAYSDDNDGIFAVMRNNRWGVIQKNESTHISRCIGKCYGAEAENKYFIIIPFKYDLISGCQSNYCIAVKKNKFGVIDKNDNIIIDFNYDYLEFSSNSKLILAAKENKYGFINIKNEEVIPFKYDNALPFTEGLAAVFINGKCGYISENGKNIIPLYYDYCYSFSKDKAAVKKAGRWGYITPQNTISLPFTFEKANPFYLNYATVKEEGKWYIINSTGSKIKELNAEDIFPFIKGIARFKRNGKYGFIDTSGKEIFSPIFDEAEDFKFPIIRAKINNTNIMADRFGRITLPDYEKFQNHTNAVIVWKSGKAGMLDKYFKEIIPPSFELIQPVSDTLFIVEKDNLYGMINSEGRYIIEPVFEELEPEKSNNPQLLRAAKNDKSGVLDISGKILIPLNYEVVEIWDDSILLKNKKYSLVSRDGNTIMEEISDETPQYRKNIIRFSQDGKYGIYSVKDKKIKIPPIYSEMEIFDEIQIEATTQSGKKVCFHPETLKEMKCVF